MCGPAGHAVNLLGLKRGHEARPLDGVGRGVAQLTLVVVAPRVHFAYVYRGGKATFSWRNDARLNKHENRSN